MSGGAVDRAIERLARRQHGVFSRAQAEHLGATRRMVERRRQSGAWLRLAAGVYALASHPATWHRQLKAAELTIPGAAVSHRAAASLHGLPGFTPCRIELSVPPTGSARSRLAVVHRRATVPKVMVDGISVVALPRVLVDLAARLPREHWTATFDQAVVDRRVTVDSLRREYELLVPTRCRGIGIVRGVLEERVDGRVPDANELERALRRLLDDPRLPPAQYQAPFPWWPAATQRVDAVIPAWRRIVEADGRRWHTRESDFARDRARDHLAQRHGYEVTRFTYHQLVTEPSYALGVMLDIRGQIA
jgi:very-short-patch-repair endonuclease